VSAIVFFVNWIKDKRNKSNAGVRLSRRLFWQISWRHYYERI
jgi:hypothetical protein